MHANAKELVEAARAYEGVRYRDQGRSARGLDCAGLIIVTARDVGISSFDTTAYGRRPNVAEFTRHMLEAGCTRLPHGQHEHGDILRFALEGWPVHIGIYEVDERGDEWVIHAYLPHRQVTRERLRPELEAKISTVWRFPE